jgi:hypothetical protein
MAANAGYRLFKIREDVKAFQDFNTAKNLKWNRVKVNVSLFLSLVALIISILTWILAPLFAF